MRLETPSGCISAALYVHVPFCRTRCAYCDFNTYAGIDELLPEYVAAVCREIGTVCERHGPLSVPTIYFGGGTPSLLPPKLLSDLLRASRSAFHVSPDVEVTLEANPGTVTPAYLRCLRELGVNRLSLGAQSAHDEELRRLGRTHTWAEAAEAVAWARGATFTNLSLDLIFGLPGQTVGRWQETLRAVLRLHPEHLSLYALCVEEGTPLEARIAKGELPAPSEDRAAEMYELAQEMLAQAGFFHYEISNWARSDNAYQVKHEESQYWWPRPETCNLTPETTSEEISSYVCRHNLTYWRNEAWLGVGAGAYSWLGGRRWRSALHPRQYVASLERHGAPVTEDEPVHRQLEMGETMMLGLRLAEGVRARAFETRFGEALEVAFGDELCELRELGLVVWDGCEARLTRRGRLLGNRVFCRFV